MHEGRGSLGGCFERSEGCEQILHSGVRSDLKDCGGRGGGRMEKGVLPISVESGVGTGQKADLSAIPLVTPNRR